MNIKQVLINKIEQLREQMSQIYQETNRVDYRVYQISKKIDNLTTLYWLYERELRGILK